MISTTIKTKHEHITCYFASEDHREQAIDDQQTELHMTPHIRMAHSVYDHITRRFIKRREGDVELANALLIVERRRHSIPDDLFDLVREHV